MTSLTAYFGTLKDIAEVLHVQRIACKARKKAHVFAGFPLERLGAHSLKRTSATMMKDMCVSTALVAAIAGTTAKTLDRVYDTPTLGRKQKLVHATFAPVAKRLLPTSSTPTQSTGASSSTQPATTSCPRCGSGRESRLWVCCPFCRHEF